MIIFDTEYTSWLGAMDAHFSRDGEYREIIQIAALRLKEGQPWEEAETFDVFVKPVLNPQLSDYIQDLTSITQSKMDEKGLSLEDALSQFADFCADERIYSNGQDISPIAETCGLQKVIIPLDVSRVRSLRPQIHEQIESYLGRQVDWRAYPSGRIYQLLDISLPTDHIHNALHDVYSLAAVLRFMAAHGYAVLGIEGV